MAGAVRVLQRIMWHDLAVDFVPLRLGGFDSSTGSYGASLCKRDVCYIMRLARYIMICVLQDISWHASCK